MEHLNLYSHEQWTDRIYTITVNLSMVHRITMMVFKGDHTIACVDSAHGSDHYLRTYIQRMTGRWDLPIIEICTHGGPDHAGGSVQFDEVYCNSGDAMMIARNSREMRLVDFEPFALYNQEMIAYVRENMCEGPNPNAVKEIEDGQIFDLGGIQIEAIRTPGHTTGHTCFYVKEDKICFAGDCCNIDTHLGRLNRAEMAEYHDMLYRFMARLTPDTKLFTAHLNRPHRMRVPINIAEACMELALNKNCEDDPPAEAIQKFFGPMGFNNPEKRMHYYNNCAVIYDRRRLNDPNPWRPGPPPPDAEPEQRKEKV